MGLLKAALYKPEQSNGGTPILPTSTLSKRVKINSSHCERYNRAVDWKLGIASVIHPNYLQVLTLPMQLEMMISKPFPFKPMGLVHLANHIDLNFLPEQSATLLLKTSYNGIAWHKKGWVFAIVSEGFVGEELALTGTSYYLSRQKHEEEVEAESLVPEFQKIPAIPSIKEVESPYSSSSVLSFPQGVGRQYARVSGDFNPIHLSRWSAKFMGFRQAIAHGMYSKALCLSNVIKQEMSGGKTLLAQTPMQFSTQFMQPIYLPSQCDLFVNKSATELDFSLRSKSRTREREHLRTKVVIA